MTTGSNSPHEPSGGDGRESRTLWQRIGTAEKVVSLVAGLIAIAGFIGFTIVNNEDPVNNNDKRGSTTSQSTPAPSPTTRPSSSINAAEAKRRFIAGANAACQRYFQQNIAVAKKTHYTSNPNDFNTQMAYTAGALDNADNLIAAMSALERPAGDEERIEKIIGYLAESSVVMRSAIDNYQRFGVQSPGFWEDLEKAAELEKQYNAAAKVYGIAQCG